MEKIERKTNWVLLLLIFGFIIISLIFVFWAGTLTSFHVLRSIIDVTVALILALAGVFLVRKLGTSGLQAKAVILLVLGFFCWAVADITWLFFGKAVVSPADAFYLLGYVFIAIGIIQGLKLTDPTIFQKKKIAILLLPIIIICAVYFYFFPFSWSPEISFLENLFTSGYVIADLLLLIPLIFLAYSMLTGALSFSGILSFGWILVGGGVVLMLVADLWYARIYQAYDLRRQYLDLSWYLAYFCFTYALVHFGRVQQQLKESLIRK